MALFFSISHLSALVYLFLFGVESRFQIYHFTLLLLLLSHLTFSELIPTDMFVVNGKKSPNHFVTQLLSIFLAGTDNSELIVAWYQRMIPRAVFSWKEWDDQTWNRNKEKEYFLMQFMLTAQKFDCNVGCTFTVTLTMIADSFSYKALKSKIFCQNLNYCTN